MNIRQAIKIHGYFRANPAVKPSAQIPYNDRQIIAASKAYWRGLRRWKRNDPSMTSRPKWQQPSWTRQSVKRGPVYA